MRLTALQVVADELADYAPDLRPRPHTAGDPAVPKAIRAPAFVKGGLFPLLRGHIAEIIQLLGQKNTSPGADEVTNGSERRDVLEVMLLVNRSRKVLFGVIVVNAIWVCVLLR